MGKAFVDTAAVIKAKFLTWATEENTDPKPEPPATTNGSAATSEMVTRLRTKRTAARCDSCDSSLAKVLNRSRTIARTPSPSSMRPPTLTRRRFAFWATTTSKSRTTDPTARATPSTATDASTRRATDGGRRRRSHSPLRERNVCPSSTSPPSKTAESISVSKSVLSASVRTKKNTFPVPTHPTIHFYPLLRPVPPSFPPSLSSLLPSAPPQSRSALFLFSPPPYPSQLALFLFLPSPG